MKNKTKERIVTAVLFLFHLTLIYLIWQELTAESRPLIFPTST
jgi:hypothetical protein